MTSPLPTPNTTPEPVLIAHAVTAVLACLVGAGWIVFPQDVTLDGIGTAIALLISTIGAFIARGKVTPTNTALPATWAQWEQVITEIATEVAQQQIDTYVARSERA